MLRKPNARARVGLSGSGRNRDLPILLFDPDTIRRALSASRCTLLPRPTDQEIADQCGITRPTVAKCLAADPSIKLYTLAAVANALGLVLELKFSDAPWANRRAAAVAVNGPAEASPFAALADRQPPSADPRFERTKSQRANEEFLWRSHQLNLHRARRVRG